MLISTLKFISDLRDFHLIEFNKKKYSVEKFFIEI